MNVSLSAFAPENLVSRDGFGRLVPRQPVSLHSQAESGAYLRDSSRVPRLRPVIYLKPPYAIGSIPSLEFIGSRNIRRHRASKPRGSSERVPPWQVTMGQLICASLSHTQYWFEVGMLKVYRHRMNCTDRAVYCTVRYTRYLLLLHEVHTEDECFAAPFSSPT